MTPTGAFWYSKEPNQSMIGSGDYYEGIYKFTFRASYDNSTYGNSSTVQPSSYRVHYLIKF